MAFTQFKHSGTLNPEISVCEKKHSSFAEKAAEEGIVLLKNENILPISLSASVALLGIGADKTVKGGIGSGDVNNRQNITIYEGMEESGIRITSRDWLDDYEHRYQKARLIWKEKILEEAKHVNNPFDAYASNPFIMPEGRPVSEMDIQEAEIVVYVISRISGEGKDRRLEKGDYYLSEREEKDILFLNSRSVPIVLLINAGGPVELTDILEKAQWIKGISWGIFLNVKFGKYSKINYQTNILHFQQPGFTFFRYKKIQDCKVFYIYLTFFSPETLHSPLILVL